MKLRVAKKVLMDVDRYGHHRKSTLIQACLTWIRHGGAIDVARNALLLYRIEGFIRV
jgi:hypothetical protein